MLSRQERSKYTEKPDVLWAKIYLNCFNAELCRRGACVNASHKRHDRVILYTCCFAKYFSALVLRSSVR